MFRLSHRRSAAPVKRPPLWGLALALPMLLSPWLTGLASGWSSLFFRWRWARPAPLVGFTPLSAAVEPPTLFALLNRYFEAIAAAVIAEEGLLDKFIGDALMAAAGQPTLH